MLYLANFKPGIDSLRFGTSSSGLTAAQLALLRFSAALDVPGKIDANGFVTPVPPPTLAIKTTGTTNVTLTWNAVSGRTYNVQHKSSLADSYWITNDITDIVVTNTTGSYTESFDTNKHRVYRLRLKAISEGT